jgi:hypothetical protein
VQAGIDGQQRVDRQRFQSAITAELLVFSLSIIRVASEWNQRAAQQPAAANGNWPVLSHPHVYVALVSLIGLIEPWAAAALIGFYGNVLDLNELSKEAMQGRLTVGANVGTIAERLRTMAAYLATSLDELNNNRRFAIVGHDLTALIAPDGTIIARAAQPPRTLQELLRAVGGQAARAVVQAGR